MTNARADFEQAVILLADMLEEKLEGEVDFSDDFEPWTFLRDTMPAMADRMEAELIEEVAEVFAQRDPNNASRMRDYFTKRA